MVLCACHVPKSVFLLERHVNAQCCFFSLVFADASIAILKPLLHPACNRPQVAVHFAGVLSKDQADNGLTGNVDVLEAAENMDFLVCEHDCCLLEKRLAVKSRWRRTSCSASIFNGEFCLAVLAGNTADCAAEMLA
jgi:hypothetical protein